MRNLFTLAAVISCSGALMACADMDGGGGRDRGAPGPGAPGGAGQTGTATSSPPGAYSGQDANSPAPDDVSRPHL